MRSALRGKEASRTVETHGRVFEAVYMPKRGAAGGVEGVIGVAYDVTDLHLKTRALEASERRLRESEARFRSLVTNMRDIIFCHGTQGDGRYGYDDGGAASYRVDAQSSPAPWTSRAAPESRPGTTPCTRGPPGLLRGGTAAQGTARGHALEYRITHPGHR